MKKIFFLLLLLASFHANSEDLHRKKYGGYIPQQGFVPDERVAVLIANAVLVPIYGEESIDRQKPFHVSLKSGVWVVEGKFPDGPGGTFQIHISKKTGAILYLMHDK
ncbi:NTF2 fold immunity protein [Massilia sp. YIM B04103]|uniref:NTF2 fold immunity protein n=1 Tax=Massilia sp. YIM B04103 TaxID=2963106 RepID=UPI00210A53C3|nr:NTF2 fold immunity protein [Massilia sp. YIM B04103]